MAPQAVLQPVLPFDINQASSLRKFPVLQLYLVSLVYIVSLLTFSAVTFSFVLSYKQPSLKLCSDKALWILKVTFFPQMNTSFPLIHLLFLQTQSISDDINDVNIQRVLCTSSGFSHMFVFEMHLNAGKVGGVGCYCTGKEKIIFFVQFLVLQGMMSFSKLLIVLLPRL